MKWIFSLLLILSVLTVVALDSGIYNMAATEKHWAVTEKIITWVRENSIEAQARNLEVPPLDDAELIVQGAGHYSAMCTGCHLAPGLEPTEISIGLYPQAPVFHQRNPFTDQTEKTEHARAYFWVIKNGLKMTAMPAWGLSHNDQTLWALVAFILKTGNMTPEDYESLVHAYQEQATEHKHDGHSH